MSKAQFALHSILVFIVAFFFVSCGGGTSGSGLKTYQGTVTTVDNKALPQVAVTIEDTGDSSFTNNEGQFAIKSNASGSEVRFLLESPQFSSRFTLKDIPDESSRIEMTVTVDPETQSTQVSNVSVRAWMAGTCDFYFENREVIRQSNRVPTGTVCSLNVRILGDGSPLANVPVALQYSSCAPHSTWETLLVTQTGSGSHTGAAELNFQFIDSETFCRYRIIAPFGVQGITGVTYPIDTFTEQEYFKR